MCKATSPRPRRASKLFATKNSLQREAADGVFADAAEIEGVVVFDDVGDLGEAVGGAVLKVFDDAA